MNPDDLICLCFHVSRRKVDNFIRVEKPKRPSQLSQCFGAGTGCGWCRPYLERLLNQSLPPSSRWLSSNTEVLARRTSQMAEERRLQGRHTLSLIYRLINLQI